MHFTFSFFALHSYTALQEQTECDENLLEKRHLIYWRSDPGNELWTSETDGVKGYLPEEWVSLDTTYIEAEGVSWEQTADELLLTPELRPASSPKLEEGHSEDNEWKHEVVNESTFAEVLAANRPQASGHRPGLSDVSKNRDLS